MLFSTIVLPVVPSHFSSQCRQSQKAGCLALESSAQMAQLVETSPSSEDRDIINTDLKRGWCDISVKRGEIANCNVLISAAKPGSSLCAAPLHSRRGHMSARAAAAGEHSKAATRMTMDLSNIPTMTSLEKQVQRKMAIRRG